MKKWIYLLAIACLGSCSYNNKKTKQSIRPVVWKAVDTIDVARFNRDLEAGKPTMDVGVYFPSNFDTAFQKVTLSRLMESVRAAKEIYKPAGVQINLLWVKTGELDPAYFSIQANETPGLPETEYTNMYVHARRHPAVLTEHAKNAFTSIVEPNEENKRTIYLIVLQDVFFPFLEVSEGRNWTIKSVRTGGLSFPTYSYVNSLPDAFRGIITITNLSRADRFRRTVAHEIGHKVMNVSHEYKTTNPGHEVFADGGLMLYGNGEDIPSGQEGRWHLERLHLSPFLYRLKNGVKVWNEDYKEGGHYYDPIYGDKVINFGGRAEIDKNW
ncbi:MAG: hypothetical protein K2U26_18175 [Cyclobacteriaceae bacterium]|nr:hypothetical protein [Cyclobacteriaceae bacterium]